MRHKESAAHARNRTAESAVSALKQLAAITPVL